MSETLHSAAATVASWRAASERGDVDAAVACLSRDVVLSSPLTEQFRFEGPDQLRDFLASAFTAVEDIRFHTETGQGDTYALVYLARVGTQPFEEAQLLRLDDEARIREITLFGRPMPALTALMISAGSELARRQGRRGVAALMRASAAPVHAMVTFGDRRVVPLTRPAARRT
jgi:ketosteroid isomerase-like protein